MTTREAVFAWAGRMAADVNIEPHHFIIQSDGNVYAMPENRDSGALGWWPLPYLGPAGESEFAEGLLFEDRSDK